MVRKKAIELPSSNKIYGYKDNSFDKNTLISLLNEAENRNLKDEDKIVTFCEYDLKLKKEIVTYKELKDTYIRNFDIEFLSGNDDQIKKFGVDFIDGEISNRGAWSWYSSAGGYIRARDM